MSKIRLESLIGSENEEDFSNFDLTEIQEILSNLRDIDAIDLSHAELLQQQALRGADILSEFLGRMIKTTSYLESKVSALKNRASLDYVSPNGKTTAEMKKWGGEADPLVEEMQVKLAKAKGSKVLLEKKYDILIRLHHHYKDIAVGLRKTILGYSVSKENNKSADGWE